MIEYPKINSIFMRDDSKKGHPFIEGQYAEPVFEYLKDNRWEFTEKVDGTQIRVIRDGGVISFAGKENTSIVPRHYEENLERIFACLPMRKKFDSVFPNNKDFCLYGEGFGYKVQGKVGIEYFPESTNTDFYLYDVRIDNLWLERHNVYDIGEKLGLLRANVVGYGTLNDAIALVKSRPKSIFGVADSEGLVLRPTVDIMKRNGDRVITKVKVRDFLEDKRS